MLRGYEMSPVNSCERFLFSGRVFLGDCGAFETWNPAAMTGPLRVMPVCSSTHHHIRKPASYSSSPSWMETVVPKGFLLPAFASVSILLQHQTRNYCEILSRSHKSCCYLSQGSPSPKAALLVFLPGRGIGPSDPHLGQQPLPPAPLHAG